MHVSESVPCRQYDYKLFRKSQLPQPIPKDSKAYFDSGYQEVNKDYPNLNAVIPIKRTSSKKELTRSEKIRNTKQRKKRVTVEHSIAHLKKYQVLSQIYRHGLQNYQETFRFVANIVNFRMLQRLPAL